MSGPIGEASARKSQELIALLQLKLGSQIIDAKVDLCDAVVRIANTNVASFFQVLKTDAQLKFNLLIDLTVIDWLDARTERFDVVYQLVNVQTLYRLRVMVAVSEGAAEIDTIVPLWSGANFMEREAWDMYGVKFRGHPDLRRILTYDEFIGYPLRKDYPVQGKQPRIPYRFPEVRNTALDMTRPPLVAINPKKRAAAP